MRGVIIDDEKQLRITLRKDVETFLDSIEIIAEADSVKTAIETIDSLKPDVVFLDIHLGDGSGFNVLERVDFKNFKTIFITAYDQYAIKAFRTNAVDYLLKPYSKDELMQAFEKVKEFYENQRIPDDARLTAKQDPDQKVAIQTSEGIELYAVRDILYCRSNGNYCTIYFSNMKKLLSGKTLKEYESILEPYGFVRVHHSYLVNFSRILRYSNKNRGFITMADNSDIPISQRKKSNVLSMLEKLLR